MKCFFRSMSPAGIYSRNFPFSNEGFRDAVDDAKRESGRRASGTHDVNVICGGKDVFILTCDGPKTCNTRYSARPHGGLGRKRRR